MINVLDQMAGYCIQKHTHQPLWFVLVTNKYSKNCTKMFFSHFSSERLSDKAFLHVGAQQERVDESGLNQLLMVTGPNTVWTFSRKPPQSSQTGHKHWITVVPFPWWPTQLNETRNSLELYGCLGNQRVSAETSQCDGSFLLNSLACCTLRRTGRWWLLIQQHQQLLNTLLLQNICSALLQNRQICKNCYNLVFGVWRVDSLAVSAGL